MQFIQNSQFPINLDRNTINNIVKKYYIQYELNNLDDQEDNYSLYPDSSDDYESFLEYCKNQEQQEALEKESNLLDIILVNYTSLQDYYKEREQLEPLENAWHIKDLLDMHLDLGYNYIYCDEYDDHISASRDWACITSEQIHAIYKELERSGFKGYPYSGVMFQHLRNRSYMAFSIYYREKMFLIYKESDVDRFGYKISCISPEDIVVL